MMSLHDAKLKLTTARAAWSQLELLGATKLWSLHAPAATAATWAPQKLRSYISHHRLT